MTPKKQHYETLAKTIIQNLQHRRIAGYYCSSKEEARELALSLVPAEGLIGIGGSESVIECGITEALRNREGLSLLVKSDGKTPDEVTQILRKAFSADCYFMSTNAITIEGELVNIDNTGNRAACLIYGPDRVIIVAGMNKVVADVRQAVSRVRNTATPPNCIRLNKSTPCVSTGHCMDCLSDDCLCNQIVITRRSLIPNRIHVILVGETLGF